MTIAIATTSSTKSSRKITYCSSNATTDNQQKQQQLQEYCRHDSTTMRPSQRPLHSKAKHAGFKKKNHQTSWSTITSVVILLVGASSFDTTARIRSVIRRERRQAPQLLHLVPRGKSNGLFQNIRGKVTTLPSMMQASSSSDIGKTTTNSDNNPSTMSWSSPDRDPNRPNSEFELQLGRALDTLRKDYPHLLVKPPAYEIYSPDIQVVDPSGVTLHSLQSYKNSFYFLHMVVRLFYHPEKSGLTFRLAYDCARKNIRVSWNAELVPRLGGTRNKLYVDGISVYELDRETGLIHQHRVERLLLNDAPVSPPPQGIFALLQEQAVYGGRTGLLPGAEGVGIPSWPAFQPLPPPGEEQDPSLMTLSFFSPEFSWVRSAKREPNASASHIFSKSNNNNENEDPHQPTNDDMTFDRDKFDRKNASRKKFGLPPISEAEFLQIEEKTRELEQVQRQKAAATASSAAEMTKGQNGGKKGNLMGKFFDSVLKDTCQNNFDCEKPEVCCDFGFKKMCCRSGMRVFNGIPGQLQPIPVRVVADDDQWQRRGGPEGTDWGY